jgi:hypothetical protein
MIDLFQLSEASKTLQTKFFLQGNTRTLFKSDPTNSPDWNIFAQSWHDLKQDNYMGDGGTYRFRRFSEFHLAQATGSLRLIPHRPYRQSKEDNYLNGEIDRLYSPMLEGIQENAVFKLMLGTFADVIAPLVPSAEWLVQVFQNRILASDGQPGQPTPEGIHRDGVDFVLTLLIDRDNVDGGESSTYAQDGKSLKASTTLKEAGDFIFLNDKLMKHSVQPINRLEPVKEGYRDALIAMFTQLSAVKR